MKTMIFLVRPKLVDIVKFICHELGWSLSSFSDPEQFLTIVGTRKSGSSRPDCLLVDCATTNNENIEELIRLVGEFCQQGKSYESPRFAVGFCSRGGENVEPCRGCRMIRIFVGKTVTIEDYLIFEQSLRWELSHAPS